MTVISYQQIGVPPKGIKVNLIRAKTEARMFANEALKQLREYPPKPSKSRYVRTYDLRRGWKKEIPPGNDLSIDIFNDVDYAGYVQGRRRSGSERQLRRFTKQGWTSLTDINRNLWPQYQIRIALALGISKRQLPALNRLND